MDQAAGNETSISGPRGTGFKRIPLGSLTELFIAQHSQAGVYVEPREYQLITPHSLDIDNGIFLSQYAIPPFLRSQ